MTISVTVSVPEGSSHKAVVKHIDQQEGNPEGVESLAGVLPPGHTGTFHAHSTRDVVVTEEPVDAVEATGTAETTAA